MLKQLDKGKGYSSTHLTAFLQSTFRSTPFKSSPEVVARVPSTPSPTCSASAMPTSILPKSRKFPSPRIHSYDPACGVYRNEPVYDSSVYRMV
ncbi:hypothetical protein VKT23_020065 [Stygiomarasmius scandens]|uniref:Uncharacterized protein n=1 Tax=Marasmiellus scandens TaxID=2682957 RepID=A0ABR1IP20_9AGAR